MRLAQIVQHFDIGHRQIISQCHDLKDPLLQLPLSVKVEK